MSFANKYNKENRAFDVETKDFAFATLDELFSIDKDKVHKIDGLYINKMGKFNPHPVAIVAESSMLVDLPSHMTDTVKEILADAESINLIKKGHVGFKVREYTHKTYNKTCYNAEWVDL